MRCRHVVERPVTVVDVETTGLLVGYHHRVVEIAVLRFDPDGSLVAEYETLVNPGRDVGATHIHSITPTELVDAPTFEEVAGDVAAILEGSTVVAHNVTFDTRFLRAEYRRLGTPLPHLDLVDTLHLPHRLGLATTGRSLASMAEVFGIDYEVATRHTAYGDAKACADLFWSLVRFMVEDGTPLRQFCLKPGWDPPDGRCMPSHPRTGRRQTRELARRRRSRDFGYLQRLAQQIDRLPVANWDERRESYLALLDRCLEDHAISAEESAALEEMARHLGMTSVDVLSAHHVFLERLAVAAWADGVVTPAERRDLAAVGFWLGVDEEGISDLLDAHRGGKPGSDGAGSSVWRGVTVCFTGTLPNGMTRDEACAAIAARGCVPVKSVTKKLDVLVVADPHTQSGKAKKARAYGTRIVAADRFFREVGIG